MNIYVLRELFILTIQHFAEYLYRYKALAQVL